MLGQRSGKSLFHLSMYCSELTICLPLVTESSDSPIDHAGYENKAHFLRLYLLHQRRLSRMCLCPSLTCPIRKFRPPEGHKYGGRIRRQSPFRCRCTHRRYPYHLEDSTPWVQVPWKRRAECAGRTSEERLANRGTISPIGAASVETLSVSCAYHSSLALRASPRAFCTFSLRPLLQ